MSSKHLQKKRQKNNLKNNKGVPTSILDGWAHGTPSFYGRTSKRLYNLKKRKTVKHRKQNGK